MFHLYPGIHFNEVKTAVLIEKFKGPRTPITDVNAGPDTGLTDFGAQPIVDPRRRRLLDHLLVPALQRAVPVAEIDGTPLPVREHLHFHVSRPLQELFDIHHRRSKGRLGLRLGHLNGTQQHLFVVYHPHTTATAAGSRLDDHRITDIPGYAQNLVRIVGDGTLGTRHRGHTGSLHLVLGRYLVTHDPDGLGGGPNENKAAVFHLFGKIGVLGQKSVARVDAVGIGDFRNADDGRNVQVALGRGRGTYANRLVRQAHVLEFPVSLGVNGHGLYAQLPTGSQHSQGNFASVGD